MESNEGIQGELENEIIANSGQKAVEIRQLEQDKITQDHESLFDTVPFPIPNSISTEEPHRQTKDFVEKHGSTIQRREDSHTGHGVKDRYHEGERASRKGLAHRQKLTEFVEKEALDSLSVSRSEQESAMLSKLQDTASKFFALVKSFSQFDAYANIPSELEKKKEQKEQVESAFIAFEERIGDALDTGISLDTARKFLAPQIIAELKDIDDPIDTDFFYAVDKFIHIADMLDLREENINERKENEATDVNPLQT